MKKLIVLLLCACAREVKPDKKPDLVKINSFCCEQCLKAGQDFGFAAELPDPKGNVDCLCFAKRKPDPI